MNAISLWQPWATAIAIGLKTIETRGWPAPKHLIGKPLAIAAAKRDDVGQRTFWIRIIKKNAPLYDVFAAAGYKDWSDLPFGKVVCTTRLVACASTNDQPPGDFMPTTGFDADLGNFSADRWAWFLQELRCIDPVPVVGRQGIFQWEEA